MFKKIRNIHFVAQASASVRMVANYCFATLAGLLLTCAWQQSEASANNHAQALASLLANESYASQLLPEQPPFTTNPLPVGAEVPIDNEIEEDGDNDLNPLAGFHSYDGNFPAYTGVNDCVQALSSAHEHSAVPYFILFHSWKSFLM